MSPFAAGTWSVVGTLPPSSSNIVLPLQVAYSASRDILIATVIPFDAFTAWASGAIYRSTDKGATWTLVQDFLTNPGPDGTKASPVTLSLLRDPSSGAERFVAVVVRYTFVGGPPVAHSVRVRIWTSPDGAVWTPGQQLLEDTSGAGAAAGTTSIATRPRGGPSAPDLEHYVLLHTGSARGTFKSIDLGLTWTLVADAITIEKIAGGAANIVLVGQPDRSLILARDDVTANAHRSSDGGQSWQPADPAFNPNAIVAFGGGPVVGCRIGTLIGAPRTQISCDDARSWPPSQLGPVIGVGGANATQPVLIALHPELHPHHGDKPSNWELLMAAGSPTLGHVDVVYSDNGGESETLRVDLDTGSGIISHLSGGVVLNDDTPLIVVGSTGHVFRSTDVPTGLFAPRVYCTTVPAPGVGFPGFPAPCGDFYDVCPQECPAEPEQPAGQVLTIPDPVTLGLVVPLGDVALSLGAPLAAILGGQPNTIFSFPALGVPEGCGATFVNEPCAAQGCPA